MVNMSLTSVPMTVELITLIILAIFLVYLFGTIIANTYVNFQPKDMGRVFVLSYMLGVLTVSYIVGSTMFILFSLALAIIFVVMSIVRLRKLNNKSKSKEGGLNEE